MHGEAVDAVADLGRRVRDLLGAEPAVDRTPGLPGVVRPERPGRRDGDEDPFRVSRVEEDRVQAHPAGPGLPAGGGFVGAQPGELVPALAAVARAEEGRILDARMHRVGIGRGRLEMPDARELPRVWGAVVPEVRAGNAVVHELVTDWLPRPAPVVGPLDQ